ncbi:MAG: TRAP transporter small permease [Desulfobacteraceae bacterium]|nr:TRAP transporter small permease [Desulfobacteraceae bacterium]
MIALLKNFINSLEEVVCCILLSTLIILMGIQVFTRFVLGSPSPACEEISRFCLVGFIYFGAALGAKRGSHYRVIVYQLVFKKRTGKTISLLGDLIWLAFNIVMVIYGVKFVLSVIEFPYLSSALMIPMKYIYPIIPIGYSLIVLRMIYFHHKQSKE